MSILVFAESAKGKIKKAGFEATYFGHLTAQSIGGDVISVVIGDTTNAKDLGKYGATKVIQVADQRSFDSGIYASILAQLATENGATTIIVNHSSSGKSLGGRLAVKMAAGLVSGVNSVPVMDGASMRVKKPVFSGKAIAECEITSINKVLTLMGNAFPPLEVGGPISVEDSKVDCGSSVYKVTETKTVDGVVPLPEAELVVSAGRGMKGPENWGIIEELAQALGATTACSRPVADTGWRPHHEHVGQTGVAVRPNLYIAIGISGAIQHLAGVNSSKTIVVINKDPEAPFFKAADYGVCADLFDVVPALTLAIKKYKTNA
ncbi:MAG: electron transfer flavoprotein subunit alpha/FixB family protein [Saprospiraceae bacterium]